MISPVAIVVQSSVSPRSHRAMATRLAARLLPGWETSTGAVVVEPAPLLLSASHGDTIPADIAPLLGRSCLELSTDGDGACALHAAFGTPDLATSQVRLENARGFLRETLGEVLPHIRPEMHHVKETVVSGLWTEFVLPYVGAGAAVAQQEEAIFLRHLRSSPHWERVVEAVASHRERQEARAIQEAIARDLSGSIFVRELDARLWSRLAMTANVEEEFGSAPWEIRNGLCLVKGTNEMFEADVSGGPHTKYAALFDPRPVFDGLRLSFLRMTCGERLVRLNHALAEYLDSEGEAHAAGTEAVLEYVQRCSAYYDPREGDVFPPWFAEAAWPCFVDSMCDRQRSYFLNANELLLSCELRRQNIVVFGRRFGEARFMGAVTGHAESPLVLVILHLDDAEHRVRSHFQRLVRSEDVQEAQEQERREAEEARELQRREAEAARIQQRELLAMRAADIEAECCRDWAGEAPAAQEQRETGEGVYPAEASTRDVEAAVRYGMEAIMAGTAYEEGWEDAEASISAGMDNEETGYCPGSAQGPKRVSRRMLDEAELQMLQQEQRERRRSTDMLSHLRLCAHRPRKHWFEQRLEGAARLAKDHLRSRVTISANLEKDPNSQYLIDSAMSLHRMHCAFKSCTGSFDEVFKVDEEKVRGIQKKECVARRGPARRSFLGSRVERTHCATA